RAPKSPASAGARRPWIDPRALAIDDPGWRLALPRNVGPARTASTMVPASKPKAPTEPSAANADWLARVERELAAREYETSVNSRGLQAPNRAQNLRTYFEPSGIRLVDRT